MIAVTGTNGKSSITHTMSGLLRTLGLRVGAIGTIGITLDGEALAVEQRTPTTPQATDLQYLLRQFVDRGATHVVMEASSIALASGGWTAPTWRSGVSPT
ncbi:UDP-N-acetylmuramyl tripeptide synthase [Actinopolymorpha rutila]|uniref:UDP-N-acetylmuramyl tripeptide synthase n=1 Tax=Actinopolymorpha rutila TaxID=446787 RepID=A0A852ZS46_9ACTN|nr:UDP-N-acetylmuramyl tripeptide synthase [Actinopolymorpha rutila]